METNIDPMDSLQLIDFPSLLDLRNKTKKNAKYKYILYLFFIRNGTKYKHVHKMQEI